MNIIHNNNNEIHSMNSTVMSGLVRFGLLDGFLTYA